MLISFKAKLSIFICFIALVASDVSSGICFEEIHKLRKANEKRNFYIQVVEESLISEEIKKVLIDISTEVSIQVGCNKTESEINSVIKEILSNSESNGGNLEYVDLTTKIFSKTCAKLSSIKDD